MVNNKKKRATTDFDDVVGNVFKNLGPYVGPVAHKKSSGRCVISTMYFYPDRSPVTITVVCENDKLKFTDEGKLFELVTGNPKIRYSGHGSEKMDLMLAMTNDVQRHFYIDNTIPECYTIAEIGETDDIIKAFYHLMGVCLIIGHLNVNVTELNDNSKPDQGEAFAGDEDDGG